LGWKPQKTDALEVMVFDKWVGYLKF
jgi:hypothetical protein